MTTVSIAQIVSHFRELVGIIDQAVIAATRAQEDAHQAQIAYTEATRGSSNREARQAVVQSRTAVEKAGKTARLLAEASNHFTSYINIIAPGTGPDRTSAPEATPTGEQVTQDAMQRTSIGFLNRTIKKADDLKDAVSSTTKTLADGAKRITDNLDLSPPKHPPTHATGTAATPPAAARPAHPHSATVHEGVSAVTIGILGAVLVTRSVIKTTTRRTRKKRQSND